jgi:hypothetical protein
MSSMALIPEKAIGLVQNADRSYTVTMYTKAIFTQVLCGIVTGVMLC